MPDDRTAVPTPWTGRQWASLGLVVLSWALMLGLYDRIPDPVPTHWNIHGRADGFTPKPWGALLSPGLLTLVWVLLSYGPRRTVDPRTGRSLRDTSAYQVGVLAVIFAVSSLHLWMLFDGGRLHPVAIVMGLMFVPLGVVLPRVPRNHIMGIRTPWSMRSEAAWEATHRFAGPVMVIAGVGLLTTGLLGADARVIFALGCLGLGVPTAASWFLARDSSR